MPNHMKTLKILTYAVVLWTLVECRHAGRIRRSLEIEEINSNLTQKNVQEVIQSDVLQHFSSLPSSATTPTSTSFFFRDEPVIPEDIKVQSLKNEEYLRATYNRKTSTDKESTNVESSDDKNKTLKTNTNDIIVPNTNQTGSSRNSKVLSHSSYEELSTPVSYNKEEIHHKNEEEQTQAVSSTEIIKVELEKKIFDLKKKEKNKKEVTESVTVPTDYNVAGKIDKPVKDNVISNKLKDKLIQKDSKPEALDEKRSTIRISNSSDSVSVSDHDNNRLGSLDILVDAPSTNEDLVNQSVNSVINSNGINRESLKQSRVKYSIKTITDVANDTERDNSSTRDNLLNEDAAKNTVPGLNLVPQTTPSVQVSSTTMKELSNTKQFPLIQRNRPTESSPTKIDIFGKVASASPTAIVKPSIAFKQQLANKLKGLDPSPTIPINESNAEGVIQDKANNKSPLKSTLRKKPKPEYNVAPSEIYIPPTATAWSLVSMKSTSESLRTSSKPSDSAEIQTVTPEYILQTSRQTTITPVTRIKSFVPWSTRLYKITSIRPPTTPAGITPSQMLEGTSDPDVPSSILSSKTMQRSNEQSSSNESFPSPLPTQEDSVIRTTLELERNMTETSFNLIQSSANDDIMIKDQSSTIGRPEENSKITENTTIEPRSTVVNNKENVEHSKKNDNSKTELEKEKENIIENKQVSKESEKLIGIEEISHIEVKEKKDDTENTKANNTETSSEVSENINEIKSIHINDSINLILTTSTTPTPQIIHNFKMKNISEVSELDAGTSDGLVDGSDDGKSSEDSEEEERPKHTTTLPPFFDIFDTTAMSDLEEDIDDNERESEEFPVIIDKLPVHTNNTSAGSNIKFNETLSDTKTTHSPGNENTSSAFITSFDIISRENTTQMVTKTPSEGDINWYSIVTNPINASVEKTSQPTLSVEVTTAAIETTNEPELVTKASIEDTTITPESTESVTTVPVTLTTFSPTPTGSTEPTVALEDLPDIDAVDDPASCVRVVVHVSPWRLCHGQQQLRESIASQLISNVSWEQVLVFGRSIQECEAKEQLTQSQLLDVDVCFIGKQQEPSPALRDEFLKLYTKRANDPAFPIVEVQTIMEPPLMSSGFDNVLAAIILSVIAAICLVLLGILLVIVRKRQGRFNYGQRCTPVSLDDYSLDNISVYNSVRRKGGFRASKRSYGNPAFDDPGGPTHPINFAGLANFSNDRAALDEEFNQIPMITVKPDELPPGAESKNRYANVIPLPETRVPLQTKEGANPLEEYINANYIKGTKGQEKLYIGCQAPLQSTVEDFWRMVWQQQTKVILMLTSLNENGVEKCADYLPQLEITDCHRLFGDFQVTLKKHEVREKYIISSLQIKNLETNLWREVTHLWYSSWPAQGVPEDGSAMIAFLIEARSYIRGAQGPTVVHCSPGTGRTGTVIAIDLCIRDFETLRSVDIPRTVYTIRRDRAGAVQTKDQYAFIYQVLNLYATKLTGGALDSI